MGKGGLVDYDNTDLFRLIFRLEGSIFDNIFPKVIVTVVLSFLAAVLSDVLGWFVTDEYGTMPPIQPIAFSVTGSSIAFLLVFRSVISYNRFWEGRGHLGSLMENARDFARQVAFCVRMDDGPADVDKDISKVLQNNPLMQGEQGQDLDEISKAMQNGQTQKLGEYIDALGVREYMTRMHGFRRLQMCRQLILMWRLTVQHLRDAHGEKPAEELWYNCVQKAEGEEYLAMQEKFRAKKRNDPNYDNGVPRHIDTEIVDTIGNIMPGKTLVTPHVADMLKGKKRRPLVIIAMLSWYLKQEYFNKNITYMEYLSMNKDLSGMIGAFNGVDKVHNVPIPFPYAQMITLLMTAYCFIAPFMFVTYFGYWCFVPASFLTCSFFGINEVAIEIEDPFGTDENDLPLDIMGDALAADCEMNLEVALVPAANIKQYWEEIAKSRQHFTDKRSIAVEKEVSGSVGKPTPPLMGMPEESKKGGGSEAKP